MDLLRDVLGIAAVASAFTLALLLLLRLALAILDRIIR